MAPSMVKGAAEMQELHGTQQKHHVKQDYQRERVYTASVVCEETSPHSPR